MVDLIDGRVYFLPLSGLGLDSRANSALLIVDPPERIPRDETRKPASVYSYHSFYSRWDERRRRLRPVFTDDPTGFHTEDWAP